MMSTLQSTACLLCRGSLDAWHELPHIWHQPKGAPPYAIFWCGNCEFGLLLPRPTQQELDSFYGDNYFARYARESSERYQGQTDFAPVRPSLLDRVRVHVAWRSDRGRPLDATALSHVIGPGPLQICDIGCGTGRLLADLQALGHHVIGVEVDENCATQNGREGDRCFPRLCRSPTGRDQGPTV